MSVLRTTALLSEERAAWRITNRGRRQALEATLDRLLSAVDAILSVLDTIDGDPDFEDGYDQETVCEDEGDWDEREPCPGECVPNYVSHHDQTTAGACY